MQWLAHFEASQIFVVPVYVGVVLRVVKTEIRWFIIFLAHSGVRLKYTKSMPKSGGLVHVLVVTQRRGYSSGFSAGTTTS